MANRGSARAEKKSQVGTDLGLESSDQDPDKFWNTITRGPTRRLGATGPGISQGSTGLQQAIWDVAQDVDSVE